MAISEFLCASISKRAYKCEAILTKMSLIDNNEPGDGTHFYMNGFALRLVLTQRLKKQVRSGLLPSGNSATGNWISVSIHDTVTTNIATKTLNL